LQTISTVISFTYNNDRTIVCPGERRIAMTAKEELIEFVTNLTDDQVEKLFNHFSELSSSLEGSSQPCPLELPLQTA
jgi:hypothetical protein